MQGRIIKESAGFYYVIPADAAGTEQKPYLCRARGIFKKKGERPSVGDIVDFSLTGTQDVEGSVDAIEERKNLLFRPPVANVDKVLIVFSGSDPDPNLLLMDRLLVSMKMKDISAAICINKSDITDDSLLSSLKETYEGAGYSVFITAARENEGREVLLSFLRGHLTALLGPSGVGKSSIMNMLTGTEAAQTGEVSRKTGQGKQTTRTSEIYVIKDEKNTFVMDTPGFSAFDVTGLSERELFHYFPEIEKEAGDCYFSGCVHMEEPLEKCAVKTALSEGLIPESRYLSYRTIFKEIESNRSYR